MRGGERVWLDEGEAIYGGWKLPEEEEAEDEDEEEGEEEEEVAQLKVVMVEAVQEEQAVPAAASPSPEPKRKVKPPKAATKAATKEPRTPQLGTTHLAPEPAASASPSRPPTSPPAWPLAFDPAAPRSALGLRLRKKRAPFDYVPATRGPPRARLGLLITLNQMPGALPSALVTLPLVFL